MRSAGFFLGCLLIGCGGGGSSDGDHRSTDSSDGGSSSGGAISGDGGIGSEESSGGGNGENEGGAAGGPTSLGGARQFTADDLSTPVTLSPGCWKPDGETECQPIPEFEPPILEWTECEGQTQVLIRIPPNSCAEISGWQTDTVSSNSKCSVDPDKSSCDDLTYQFKQITHVDSHLGRGDIYINRRPDCEGQWEARLYAGWCDRNLPW